MQGVDVQAFTANMLTPDSLAELMGGPDIASIPPAGPPGGAPPNAYDQNNPLPPPWYPGPIPPPAPGARRDPRSAAGVAADQRWRTRARPGGTCAGRPGAAR